MDGDTLGIPVKIKQKIESNVKNAFLAPLHERGLRIIKLFDSNIEGEEEEKEEEIWGNNSWLRKEFDC